MSNPELNFSATTKKSESADKNVQNNTNLCANLVAADVLKTAEVRMQNKGMLPGGNKLSHNPLWFLVETEKNVFLWRSGHSLQEKQEFEFWVDLEALIEKRLAQLERSDFQDPMLHAFNEFELGVDPKAAEKEYLQSLLENFAPILSHLAALSEVQREILEEGLNQSNTRVVLPLVKPQRK